MQILDKGELRLIDFMGGDVSVVAAARVSNGVTFDEASKGEEKDAKLINYLMKHRHFTPFEHSVFKFYVKCPIFVAREWHRHRMASYNEISGRYVELEEFYIPEVARIPAATNKQGSVMADDKKLDSQMKSIIDVSATASFSFYRKLLDIGIAKEVARSVLPLSTYTQFYYTSNARSLLNFISLRAAEDAQWEIRQYALCILNIFKEKMPMTYAAFEAYGIT